MRLRKIMGRMASSLFVGAVVLATTSCRSVESYHSQGAEAEIRRLYRIEQDNLLRMDIAGQDQFLPEDFVVTNPFGMYITKREVIERLQANIIKYVRYDRAFDAFIRHGDTMIVIGSETVVPSADARRPDAGQTVHRRFTEVWVWRNAHWQKVARHASNLHES